jgi:hypothetical protein
MNHATMALAVETKARTAYLIAARRWLGPNTVAATAVPYSIRAGCSATLNVNCRSSKKRCRENCYELK